MLKVWGRKTSSNVQALMWCIGELGLVYDRIDAGHIYGGTDTDEFFNLNPNRTVPVIQDGLTAPLWETGSILRYLASKYGNESFWPKELLKRTEVDKWAEWSKINIALGFTAPVFWRVIRTSAKDQNLAAIQSAVTALECKMLIAENQLQNQEFLAGDKFSLADIQFGHILFRYFDIDIVRSEMPALADYHSRLCERSAYKEHVMVSYEELFIK